MWVFLQSIEGKFEENRISNFMEYTFTLKISPDSSYIVIVFPNGVIINTSINWEKLLLDQGHQSCFYGLFS